MYLYIGIIDYEYRFKSMILIYWFFYNYVNII